MDLTLWQAEEKVAPFFLLKDRFLLVFSNQIDGRTPLMTFITHKSYLTLFFHSLTKKNARKISYSGDEVAKLLETDPFLITRLAGGHFDAVYNFLPIGYLSSPEEFAQMNGKEPVKRASRTFFAAPLKRAIRFSSPSTACLLFTIRERSSCPCSARWRSPKTSAFPI